MSNSDRGFSAVERGGEMRTINVLRCALCALLLLAASTAAACEGETPESVVGCYTQAYAERDPGALQELYAEDFVWVMVSPPRAEVWDRERTMESARNMFAHPDVSELSLELAGGFEVVEGELSDTWRIEGVEATLITAMGEGTKPQAVNTCATLYVRRVSGRDGEFEIYREVTFGNGDCAEWVRDVQPEKDAQATQKAN